MPENDAGRYAVLNNYATVGIEDVYTTDCNEYQALNGCFGS